MYSFSNQLLLHCKHNQMLNTVAGFNVTLYFASNFSAKQAEVII